jgi:transposase
MTKEDEREVQRKLRVLQHAEKTGHAARTCRYFGIARASFYRWKRAYERDGKDGLVNAKTIPKNPPNQTPPEVAEKVLHLRRKYHLGPERIMWYLARYHGIKLSDATIYRILKRNGLNRLPRGTRLRKVHTKRYNKQVPPDGCQVPDFYRKEGREDTPLPIYGD